MINRNKFGFGTYEVLTVCVMLLIIVVVALAYVFRTDYKEKYSVMEYNARMFSLSSTNLYIEEGTRNVYYLQMLLDKKIFSEVKNPFQGKKYCDSYNSKVEFKDDKKYVTLECGNYLIYQQDTLAKSFAIYQVDAWSDKKSKDDNQTVTFYNYNKNGKKIFDRDMEEELFLYEFNKTNGTKYEAISDIPEQSNIVKTTLYRHIEKVSD